MRGWLACAKGSGPLGTVRVPSGKARVRQGRLHAADKSILKAQSVFPMGGSVKSPVTRKTWLKIKISQNYFQSLKEHGDATWAAAVAAGNITVEILRSKGAFR